MFLLPAMKFDQVCRVPEILRHVVISTQFIGIQFFAPCIIHRYTTSHTLYQHARVFIGPNIDINLAFARIQKQLEEEDSF